MGRQPAALPGWLLTDLTPTLRLATALAGSTRGAADLVAETLALDPPPTGRAAELDPTPRWRIGVVRTFLASPLGRSAPPVRTGLDALTGATRAAVVLRDGERLTVGEIASILDRPAKRVAADLAEVPAGDHDPEIAELAALAPPAAAVADRFAGAVRRIRSRRRRRTGLLAAATTAVLVAVAIPTMVLPRLPAEVKPVAEWRFSHEVRAPEGWRVTYRGIYPDHEQTNVTVPWPAQDQTACLVTVATVPGGDPDRPKGQTEQPTSVGGRPGVLIDAGGNNLTLAWRYADHAWAWVQCPNAPVPESLLRELAGTVRFRDARQLLPFMLDALPDGYRIRTVGESYEDPDWGPFLVMDPPADSYWPIVLIGPNTSDADQGTANERCLGADRSICVTAAQSDDQIPVQSGVGRSVLATVVAELRLAPDPTDRAGWFDATGLPG